MKIQRENRPGVPPEESRAESHLGGYSLREIRAERAPNEPAFQ